MAEIPQHSTLDAFFAAGFTIMGDSRDFTNGSIQITLSRGQERLTWTFPMKKALVSLFSEKGGSILDVAPSDLSFDVVMASPKLPEESNGV